MIFNFFLNNESTQNIVDPKLEAASNLCLDFAKAENGKDRAAKKALFIAAMNNQDLDFYSVKMLCITKFNYYLGEKHKLNSGDAPAAHHIRDGNIAQAELDMFIKDLTNVETTLMGLALDNHL